MKRITRSLYNKRGKPVTNNNGLQGKPVVNAGGLDESLPFKKELILLFIILSVTLVAFFPSLGNGFVFWDDPEYTYENPLLKDFNLARVFSFSAFYMGNYHPLTITWLYLETMLFPKGDPTIYHGFEPFWFHLNNLLLHLLNTVLVFYVIYELLERKGWKTTAVTALLFGIHPMHVESVAWVSELKDVLYSAFFLGAAWLYLRYIGSKNVKLLAASFFLFLLSCLAKGQAVTLPLLLLLFDYFRGRKFDKTALLEKVPFFAVSIIFGIVAIQAQAAGATINQHFYSINSFVYGFYGLLTYLWKFFLPINLSGSYPYPFNPFKPLPGYFYLMPVIVSAIIFAVYKTLKYSKNYLFGFLFFVLAISVTLRFLPLGDSVVSERYTYIPYIGLFFMFGCLYSKYSGIPRWNRIAGIVLVLVTMVFATLTWQRTKVWKDSFSFWGNVSETYPDYWRSYNCLGQEYTKAGNYSKALENFNYACERDQWAPPDPFNYRGAFYVDYLKEYDKGITDFRKVLSLAEKNGPLQLETRKNLGLAYNKKGDFGNALIVLDEAIMIDPDQPVSYFLKGIALTGLTKYADAETAFTNAIKRSPGFADAYFKRGILYTDNMGEYDKGIADFREVLKIHPGDKKASVNMGICYFKKNMLNEAIEIFTREVNADSGDGMLFYLRSLAYIKENKFVQAFNDMTRAKQLGIKISDSEWNDIGKKAKSESAGRSI